MGNESSNVKKELVIGYGKEKGCKKTGETG
jgi:hypothetical protein